MNTFKQTFMGSVIVSFLMTTSLWAIDPLYKLPDNADVVSRNGWTFFTEGPVHFEPVLSDGKAYFSSDDGYLYCVDDNTGQLVWKVRGGPSDQKMIDADDRRLISAWPARG